MKLKQIIEPIKYKGPEKLSKISIFFIIILNIFVYSLVSSGIYMQTKLVNNPDINYPYKCRNIFNYMNEPSLSTLANYTYRGEYKRYINKDEIHPLCKQIEEKIYNYNKKYSIVNKNKEYKKLKQDIRKKEYQLEKLGKQYDTSMLEQISGNRFSTQLNLQNPYYKLQTEISSFKEKLQTLEKEFKETEEYKEIVSIVNNKENKAEVINLYKKEKKYYYVKQKLISLLISIPLFLIALKLVLKYLKEDKYTHYMISKNLMFVFAIPMVMSVISIIYYLIPKVFLTKLFHYLMSINIPVIIHYILIAVAIVIFSFIIIKVQKRDKNKEKNNIQKFKLIEQNKCFNCEHKVDYIFMNSCPYCGVDLKNKCDKCNNNSKIINTSHCYNCGE